MHMGVCFTQLIEIYYTIYYHNLQILNKSLQKEKKKENKRKIIN